MAEDILTLPNLHERNVPDLSINCMSASDGPMIDYNQKSVHLSLRL